MLNLDKPLYMQYLLWLGKTVRGDLGRSLLGQKDVADLIGEKVLNTLELTIFSWIVSTLIGIPLGVLVQKRAKTSHRSLRSQPC